MKLDWLLRPLKIGRVTLPNRAVMAPMAPTFPNNQGRVIKRLIDYYAARAKGGVGLIIVEFTAVHPLGKIAPNQLAAWDDSYIPGLKALADRIHSLGAYICLQIGHAGRQTSSAYTGSQPLAPSPVTDALYKETPRELTRNEIQGIVEAFGQAARRAVEAGFDAVEIHGAHGYLPGQFLSPFFNRRQDEYGGSLEGRLRFSLEVLRRIRERVGADFPVSYRFSAEEGFEGGLTLEESLAAAPRLVEVGASLLHVSRGTNRYGYLVVPPMMVPSGSILPLAEAVKRVVYTPVIGVGRLDPLLAEEALSQGRIDLAAFGRALLADPEMISKAREGRWEDIYPCIACKECMNRRPLVCVQNPALGREGEFEVKPAKVRKRVVVVGGGPAGMEAALTSARRGHKVTLYEREHHLGGKLNLAALPPTKGEWLGVVKPREAQLRLLGVGVKLGKEATPRGIKRLKPDAVIIATGSRPLIPPLAGLPSPRAITAEEALTADKGKVGDRVLVIGGGSVGCEVADFLATSGRRVTVVEMADRLAPDLPSDIRYFLLQRLSQKGVALLTGTEVKALAEDRVKVAREGREETLGPFTTVVLALGGVPEDSLAKELKGIAGEVYVIGDAHQPRRALEAIAEGAEAGRRV